MLESKCDDGGIIVRDKGEDKERIKKSVITFNYVQYIPLHSHLTKGYLYGTEQERK